MELAFRKKVNARPGGENLNLCYSCGSCTATCPISKLDNDFNPRLIIKQIQLGLEKEVLEGIEIWKCLQCHRCVAHCPQNVKFADVLRVLRELAVEQGKYPSELIAAMDIIDEKQFQERLNALKKFFSQRQGVEALLKSFSAGGEDSE